MSAWIVKLAGAALILVGSGMLGSRYRRRRLRTCAVLESIVKTMRMMREKILHENDLIQDCMRTCGESFPVEEGNLFAGFGAAYTGEEALCDAWKRYVTAYFPGKNLVAPRTERALCDFGEAFCHISGDSLLAALDDAVRETEAELEAQREQDSRNGALSWKVTLACGALLVILLY